MVEIILGVVAFTAIVLVLTLFVLGAQRLLVPSGTSEIFVNGRKTIAANLGQRLLDVLTQSDIFLPSACGGAGTCGLCKVRVIGDKQTPGAQELAQLTRAEAATGVRLACQVPVLGALNVEVDEASFGIQTAQCEVSKVRQLSPFIREITLTVPEDKSMDFRAGGFIEIDAPPFRVGFADFDIDEAYLDAWAEVGQQSLEVKSTKHTTRAYSLANHPVGSNELLLNIRIALPPPGQPNVPAGIVSSWLFSRKPGDSVSITGCFGHFFVDDGDKELVFVGGGVGMAPLRAQILDLLETRHSTRKMSFWYGARSKRDLYYEALFDALQADHDNFTWHVVLSEPEPDDDWQGLTGFVHQALNDGYLADHPAPEDCEYFLCGPPLMVKAVRALLYDLGVDDDNIHYDDFGSAP